MSKRVVHFEGVPCRVARTFSSLVTTDSAAVTCQRCLATMNAPQGQAYSEVEARNFVRYGEWASPATSRDIARAMLGREPSGVEMAAMVKAVGRQARRGWLQAIGAAIDPATGHASNVWERLPAPVPQGENTFETWAAGPDETWRQIGNAPQGNEVSDYGRVRTLRCPKGLGYERDKDGYIRVSLRNFAGKPVHRQVHRLVLEAFVGHCPTGQECRHLNGQRDDNRLSNLVWATHTENCADKAAHGTAQRGSKHPRAKYTEEIVATIRSSDEPSRVLAERLGLPQTVVAELRSRKRSWTHVPNRGN